MQDIRVQAMDAMYVRSLVCLQSAIFIDNAADFSYYQIRRYDTFDTFPRYISSGPLFSWHFLHVPIESWLRARR